MTFDEKYYNIGFLDQLSYKNTFVHRLDPRAKLIATLLFLFTVISFSKYEIVALLPFFLYPMLLMTIGEIPFIVYHQESSYCIAFRRLYRDFQSSSGFRAGFYF